MTDAEVVPFIGKLVQVTLTDGRTMVGRLCATEAQLMGVGRYAVAYRTGNDPILHPETFSGIQYTELIASIREISGRS